MPMKLRLGMGRVLLGLMLSPAAFGEVIVNVASQDAGGGTWDYEFTIVNTGPEQIATVIVEAPQSDASIAPSISAPAGASAIYAATVGSLVFLRGEQSPFIAGTATAGFTLNSLSAPASTPFRGFQAIPTAGDDVNGDVQIDGFVDFVFSSGFE